MFFIAFNYTSRSTRANRELAEAKRDPNTPSVGGLVGSCMAASSLSRTGRKYSKARVQKQGAEPGAETGCRDRVQRQGCMVGISPTRLPWPKNLELHNVAII
jgi:hypothetical protein